MSSLHRCLSHPNHRITGICAYCLQERLLDLIQSISPSDTDSQDEPETEADETERHDQEEEVEQRFQETQRKVQESFHGNAENMPPFLPLPLPHLPLHHAHQQHQQQHDDNDEENQGKYRHQSQASPYVGNVSSSERDLNVNVTQKGKKSSWFSSSKKNPKKPCVAAGSPMMPMPKEGLATCNARSPLDYVRSMGRKSTSDVVFGQAKCNRYRDAYQAALDGVSESIAMDGTSNHSKGNNSNINKHSWLSSLFHRKRGAVKRCGAQDDVNPSRLSSVNVEDIVAPVVRDDGMTARLSLDGGAAHAHHLKSFPINKKSEDERRSNHQEPHPHYHLRQRFGTGCPSPPETQRKLSNPPYPGTVPYSCAPDRHLTKSRSATTTGPKSITLEMPPCHQVSPFPRFIYQEHQHQEPLGHQHVYCGNPEFDYLENVDVIDEDRNFPRSRSWGRVMGWGLKNNHNALARTKATIPSPSPGHHQCHHQHHHHHHNPTSSSTPYHVHKNDSSYCNLPCSSYLSPLQRHHHHHHY